MVISDDNFATIVTAVKEGRAIFENIRKTLLYLLSGNVAEIVVMAVAVIVGWPMPLVAIQLLWINLVTDGFPALALVTDPADGDLLRRPPRKPGAEIADRDFIAWLAASALLASVCTLGAYAYGLFVVRSVETARTLAFSTLVVEEVLRSFALRSRTRILWEVGVFSNVRLAIVALITVAMQIYSHHAAWLGGFLHSGTLSWPQCIAVTALAFVPVTLLEAWKLVRRWSR